MKKLLYLFSAIVLILTSCSSDDDSNNASVVLLKKAIDTYEDGSTETTEYEYSGTKLVKMSEDDGEYRLLTYTGNLITKIEFFLSDNTLDQIDTYTYDSSERLIQMVRVFPNDTDWGNKETYTYNANGTVTASYYSGDYTSQTNLDDTATITISNNSVTQIAYTSGRTITYTYDSKKNPMINALGLDKLIFTDGEGDSAVNNVLTVVDSEGWLSSTGTLQYNSQDYPTSGTTTEDGEDIETAFIY